MIFILILLAIFAFLWYYKSYYLGANKEFGKSKGSQNGFSRFFKAAKSFKNSFSQGVMQERLNEYKRRMNYYVIALLAKIAKSDGRVSQQEADLIGDLLDANSLDFKEREFLKTCFNEHKNDLSNAYAVAAEFMREVPLPRDERLNVFRVFVFAASIEGLSSAKIGILEQIARAFELSQYEFESFISGAKSSQNSAQSANLSLEQAYALLELNSNASAAEVKKAYRALVKKYHPDILNAAKVSQSELEAGVEKFRQITAAYELIKKHLGI